ncbi:SAM-dependent methyltransferase [Sphaerisporangium krabiense]|uniref:SAM-dependent methyltransferase n=1 Tax=Sphaerisporangium krabiense TaxID=763782 RepID=A0A7W8Z2L5_9ACTN|nr:class I SAM-dependent methyltransferase [Sphaerisporangium krabiense]MBB5626038.1 SAM-dependent methyltransferase [Sphaerisporangium krabiense]GII64843.1 SAM-dependent methyltransferase [Sphaerisporangium krabiense]
MTVNSRLETAVRSPATDRYLPSASLDEYLGMVAARHPELRARLDDARMRSADRLSALVSTVNEFESDASGRGDSYRRAQQDVSVRWTGARRLLRLATPAGATGEVTVLDVLGGDGVIARAVAENGGAAAKPTVLTGDISGTMVERALAMGLPAVRQAADFLFLRDASVDAVLLAYGTHHIAPADRSRAMAEALRVTRPGGRVVIHDFDEASPMARFFAELVHPHSAAGHDYRHFSREDMVALFHRLPAGVRVVDVYDPLVVRGRDPETARRRMCDYVADMYGIHQVMAGEKESSWRLLEEIFDHSAYLARIGAASDTPRRPTVHEMSGYCVAEVPRMALAAVAERVS